MVEANLDAQGRKDQLQFERDKVQLLADIERDSSNRKAHAQKEVDLNCQQLEALQQVLEREKLALRRHDLDACVDAKIVAAQISTD